MKTKPQHITVTKETRSKLIVELTKAAMCGISTWEGKISDIVDCTEAVADELIKRGHVCNDS